MSYDLCKDIGWMHLLEGASKFELLDLLNAIETYLIDQQNEWIQQNIVTVHKYAASMTSLNKLLAYCDRTLISHPEIVFKSNDLTILPKETLITLLKNDELNIDEDDIWMAVIQWGTKQVPELELGSDPDDWSSNDCNTVKDIIADCMPYIRFSSITFSKIVLYHDVLPKKLCRDILNYHADKNYKLNAHMLPPRTGQHYKDSLIINQMQAKWIMSKIVESTMQQLQDSVYELTLLYRKSRDGNTAAKFRELCNKKGPTIAVGKVLGTEEILGGYNPLAWGFKTGDYNTKGSFIFALDTNMHKNIVSFVGDNGSDAITIGDHSTFYPIFGPSGNRDLSFGNGTDSKPYAKKGSYQVSIRQSTDKFEWTDWEVFLVSKL